MCWGCCLPSDQLSVVFESEMCVKDKERRAAEDTRALLVTITGLFLAGVSSLLQTGKGGSLGKAEVKVRPVAPQTRLNTGSHEPPLLSLLGWVGQIMSQAHSASIKCQKSN